MVATTLSCARRRPRTRGDRGVAAWNLRRLDRRRLLPYREHVFTVWQQPGRLEGPASSGTTANGAARSPVASTAAGGDDRFDGSAVQARAGRAPGVLVAATRDAVPTILTNKRRQAVVRLAVGRMPKCYMSAEKGGSSRTILVFRPI